MTSHSQAKPRCTRPSALLAVVLAALVGALLAGCGSAPPSDINDGCVIFTENDDWYDDAMDSYERWGVPVHVQLAIIYQESKFIDDAKAPRDTLLWVIPWGRKSSAYGYAQVKDETWDWYISKTGNRGADRDDFEDVVDFIGWYGNLSHRTLGISKWDAYRQYLAYHEGHGGYRRKTYANKPWLTKVARKVDQQAKRYHTQLSHCQDELDRGSWFWPF